ncbi:hypothetical protein KFL_011090010 [Klebsormidium nitens]|uniref:SF3 helicase domain-containing protein n=1 Tax=Klebsormidium nitens TaxID=105231 RepID=A0A1Y1IRS3_KLENI|nr:hypothetical protein KFL_011090010 [Klebsormidium nitens]|eukprot:GAQ92722.1 hypothetical protein KFL_011090010 [Klebsormidium nitens]
MKRHYLGFKDEPITNFTPVLNDLGQRHFDKPDEDIMAGMPLWQRLIAENGDPPTLRVSTLSGGLHYYFLLGESLNNGLKSGKDFVSVDFDGQLYGIDGRGEGGIAFCPPSTLGDGLAYKWNTAPIRANIKPAPAWVIESINGCAKRAGQMSVAPTLSCRFDDTAMVGGFESEKDEVPDLGTGESGESCIDESSLTPRDAEPAESKIADGKLHPTHDRTMFPANCGAGLSKSELQAHLNLIRRNVTQRYRGMAGIFSAMHLIDGRILAQEKTFQYWTGRRWITDNAFHVQSVFSSHMSRIMSWYANQRASAYKKEIHAQMRASKTWGDVALTPESDLPEWASNPDTDEEKKACAAAWKVVNRTYPLLAKGDLVDLTRGSEVRVCLEFVFNSLQAPEELGALMDIANPFLFACANGVIDTETGVLQAFHPAHLCSRASKAAFRGLPKGGSRFERFHLDSFNGDREVLDWYQLFSGYCMTADTSEHIFLIKHGSGANGKSMTRLAMFKVLGQYAVVMSEDCIIEAGKRSAGAASSHIMALKGARAGDCDESNERARMNEGIVKGLSGSDTTTARELQSRQETFQLSHKAILNTNFRPILENVDYALSRRMAILPMLVTFKPPEQLDLSKPRQKAMDPTLEAYLKSDLGREEGLSWYAEGARKYFELKRTNPNSPPLKRRPRIMVEAGKAYEQDSDIAMRWIMDQLEFEDIEPGARPTWHLALGERLGGAFRAWLREEDLTSSLSATALKKRIVLYADGANRVLEDGRFTDRQIQERGQFKGLAGVRLKPGCEYEETYN